MAAAALLVAGIAFAVSRLYSTGGQSSAGVKVGEQWTVLRAVPSDAVAVMVFDGSRAAQKAIADSTGILKTIIAQDSPALMDYLNAVGKHSTVVSLLTSGSLVPLVITLTDKADSASVADMAKAAEKAGLKAQVKENFLIASRSETFIGSSARHIQDGSSILDVKNLDQLAAAVKGPAVMFLNHSHAGKLLQVYSTPGIRKQSAFVKDLTGWSAWSVAELTKDSIVLDGTALPGEAAASWLAAFQGTPDQAAEFPEVLPYFAGTAISIPVTDACVQNRRAFEDGRGKLPRFDKALKDRAKRELTPGDWFKSLQAREIVLASFQADDVVRHIVLVRSAKDLKLGKEAPNPYRGCIGLLFGEYFAIADTVCSSLNSRWSVFGDLPSLQAFDKGEYTLKERMSDASPRATGRNRLCIPHRRPGSRLLCAWRCAGPVGKGLGHRQRLCPGCVNPGPFRRTSHLQGSPLQTRPQGQQGAGDGKGHHRCYPHRPVPCEELQHRPDQLPLPEFPPVDMP